MAYKIAICDDSKEDGELVAEIVRRWSKSMGEQTEPDVFSSSESFLFSYAQKSDYDILLLDIEMPETDGVTLAKQIRRRNETIQIIFTTGYSDYISEGYEVAALHYLLKPVKEEKLSEVLSRAADKLKKNERFILIEQPDGMIRLPLREISYIDVRRNYVTFHAKRDYAVKKTLSEIETLLDERFFRAGRSTLINLSFVSRVTRSDVYLTDGSRVPIPRSAYEPLNRAIIAMN